MSQKKINKNLKKINMKKVKLLKDSDTKLKGLRITLRQPVAINVYRYKFIFIYNYLFIYIYIIKSI